MNVLIQLIEEKIQQLKTHLEKSGTVKLTVMGYDVVVTISEKPKGQFETEI